MTKIQNSKDRKQKAEDGRQKAEDGRQKIEDERIKKLATKRHKKHKEKLDTD